MSAHHHHHHSQASDHHTHGNGSGQDCTLSDAEAATLVAKIVAELRQVGIRRTEALVDLLTAMTREHQPYTLAQLAAMPELKDRDQATVYRLIMKLKDAGRVRQLNLSGRVSHFQIVIPGHHHDYLICDACGDVSEVPVRCALAPVEKALSEEFGWQGLHHELEFYGTCPKCVAAKGG